MTNVETIIKTFETADAKEQRAILKRLENVYSPKWNRPELVKGLVISKIVKHKGGKYLKYSIENIDELDFDNLLPSLYHLLYTNTKFKNFSRNKILDFITVKLINLEDKTNRKRIDISKDNVISNFTSKDDFIRIIKRNVLESANLSKYYPSFEIVIWKTKFKPKNNIGINKKIELITE